MEIEIEIKRIFLSGPVSSIIKEKSYISAVLAFEDAEKKLRELYPEAEIINPMKICKAGWSWLRCMMKCLCQLFWCDTMAQMHGWQNSRGSRIERCFAERWHLNIIRLWKYAGVTVIKTRRDY